MADCRLRLEAARYDAERVVTRLLRDHDAWGQVSREGRPKEKVPETRAELRSRRDDGEPLEKALPVRFENLRLEKNSASAGGPEEEGLGPLGASGRKGPPQVRRWAPTGSKGGRGAQMGSLASGTCTHSPLITEGDVAREAQCQENIPQPHGIFRG